MADSRANIDLVFRNGLMDYEVLPPSEVWDNIQAAVNVPAKKTSSLVFFGFSEFVWAFKDATENNIVVIKIICFILLRFIC